MVGKNILAAAIFLVLFGCISQPPTPIEEMKKCQTADECTPVLCHCYCSGCGGFSSEDIVNEKYAQEWKRQHGCENKEIACPAVCCAPSNVTLACENGYCTTKPKESQAE